MDAIDNLEAKKISIYDDQSPNTLYIAFFVFTVIFLGLKYQRVTSSIIVPENPGDKWAYQQGRSTPLNIMYLLIVICSQLYLLVRYTKNICGNYNNLPQILAKGGTTWGLIFTSIFVIINFFFSSWKGPFSNTIGYEISSRVFGLEKQEEFLSNFLNDPNSVGADAPKSLVRILTKILKDRDKKSIRELINGITLDDFTEFINTAIRENIVKSSEEPAPKEGGKKRRRRKKRGGADNPDLDAVKADGETTSEIAENAKEEEEAAKIASEGAATEPAATETADAEPAATEPEATEPEATEPAATEPEATETAAEGATPESVEATEEGTAEAPAEGTEEGTAEAPAEGTEEGTPEASAEGTEEASAEASADDTAGPQSNKVIAAISKLFKAICLKDIISEFIWLMLAGSLSILVSYTFLLQQKCATNPGELMQEITQVTEKVQDNVDPIIEDTQKSIKKRAKMTREKLEDEKESFTGLNDTINHKKSFNKDYQSQDFWLGQPYKSSLELGDYDTNMTVENREIKKRIKEQGLQFLSK